MLVLVVVAPGSLDVLLRGGDRCIQQHGRELSPICPYYRPIGSPRYSLPSAEVGVGDGPTLWDGLNDVMVVLRGGGGWNRWCPIYCGGWSILRKCWMSIQQIWKILELRAIFSRSVWGRSGTNIVGTIAKIPVNISRCSIIQQGRWDLTGIIVCGWCATNVMHQPEFELMETSLWV